MSLFQSGPYQSKVLSYVVRQTRQWLDRSTVTLRQLKTTASWSAQIVLYPVYAAVQTLRLTGAQLRQAVEYRLPRLKADRPAPTAAPVSKPGSSLSVETPLRRSLQLLQEFALPVPVLVPAENLEILPLAAAPLSSGFVSVSPGLVSVEKFVETDETEVYIRGIAIDLATRRLVLVNNHNEVFDILTPDQHRQLQARMTWEVADYGRSQKSLWQRVSRLFGRSSMNALSGAPSGDLAGGDRPRFSFPKLAQLNFPHLNFAQQHPEQPQPEQPTASQRHPETQVPVLHALGEVLIQGFRWGQAQWQTIVQVTRSLDLPTRLTLEPPPLPPTADTAILHALATSRNALSPDWLLLLNASIEPGVDSLVEHSETELAIPTLSSGSDNSPDCFNQPSAHIRGIATWLETRSLVLVTNQNQILDLLTPEQQTQLRRRITLDVADYGRYQQLQQAPRRVLSRLRPPAKTSMLPPVQAFWHLMAWIQTGTVAIAANLFQEATIAGAPDPLKLPTTAGSTVRSRLPAQRNPPLNASFDAWDEPPHSHASGGLWVASVESGFAESVSEKVFTLALPPALPALLHSAKQNAATLLSELSGLQASVLTTIAATVRPTSGSRLEPMLDLTQSAIEYSVPSVPSHPNATTSNAPARSHPHVPTHSPDYIETEATLLGYLQSPTQKALRWLDRCFVWLESALLSLWKWLRRYFFS